MNITKNRKIKSKKVFQARPAMAIDDEMKEKQVNISEWIANAM